MASYDVYITYTKKSGKGNKKRQEIINCKDMMEATLKRLDIQDNEEIEKVEIKINENNEFPFDQPDLFED